MILELIKKFFGVGDIKSQGKDSVQYRVTSVKDLIEVIIPHLEKFPLITQKRADFILFKQVVNLMYNKEHLTVEGFQKILNLKARAGSEVRANDRAQGEELVRYELTTEPKERN